MKKSAPTATVRWLVKAAAELNKEMGDPRELEEPWANSKAMGAVERKHRSCP
jgi:hypothetical protein